MRQRTLCKDSGPSINASELCLPFPILPRPGITLFEACQDAWGWLTTLTTLDSWRRTAWPCLSPSPTASILLLSATTIAATESSSELRLRGRGQRHQGQSCPIISLSHGVTALLWVIVVLMWRELRKIALVISLNLSTKLTSMKIFGFKGAEVVAVVLRT